MVRSFRSGPSGRALLNWSGASGAMRFRPAQLFWRRAVGKSTRQRLTISDDVQLTAQAGRRTPRFRLLALLRRTATIPSRPLSRQEQTSIAPPEPYRLWPGGDIRSARKASVSLSVRIARGNQLFLRGLVRPSSTRIRVLLATLEWLFT